MKAEQIFERRFAARPFLDWKTEACPCGFGGVRRAEAQKYNADLIKNGPSPLLAFDLVFAGSCMFHHEIDSHWPPTRRDLLDTLRVACSLLRNAIREDDIPGARAISEFLELWDRPEREFHTASSSSVIESWIEELGDYRPSTIEAAAQKRKIRLRRPRPRKNDHSSHWKSQIAISSSALSTNRTR